MMKKHLIAVILCLMFFCVKNSFGGHGMALVGFGVTTGPTGITINASSDSPTCGGGPYWLQVEVRCTAGQLTGTPPATMQTQLLNWAGPGVNYNAFPWFNSLLNVPNYSLTTAWPDNCVVEPYQPVFIPFAGLCPGQVYYFSAREWVSGTNSVGPWTAAQSFTVPGVFTPLNFNVSANPALFCAPGCSTLSATGITGGCGTQSILWQPGGMTTASPVVCPAANTTYTCVLSTPCQTVTKTTTVTVVPVVSAAFTPVNSTTCTGGAVVFNHMGTAGVSHTWAATPAAGVTITGPNSASPSITFNTAGAYVISHTVALGSCTNVVTTNITVNGVSTSFSASSYTQCLQGNSFTFNAGSATGTHTFAFNPPGGAPATGNLANYGPVSFTAPGTYTVTYSNSNGGCTASSSSVMVINPQPSASATQTNPTCGFNNGTVVISNTSGAGQTVMSYSFNGAAIPTQTVTNLGAGTHTIGLTNNFGCIYTFTVNLVNSPAITALATSTIAPTCGNTNGSISTGVVSGGTAPYQYNINGGVYGSGPYTNLAAGTYTIGIIDNKGCVFTKNVTLTNVPGPSALNFTTTPNSCSGAAGSVTIGVTGGTPAYTYTIDGLASGSTTTGLSTGVHTALISDLNGCIITSTFNIGSIGGPTSATIFTTSATCGLANGSATVTGVTGGAVPYQYSFNGGPFGASNTVAGLTAGTKTVVVRDNNNCLLTLTFTISNTGSPSSNIAASSNALCNGVANGSFTVNTVGGVPAYGYTLTPGGVTNVTGIFTGLLAQNYTVTIQDAMTCTTIVTATISQPPALTLTLTPFSVSCNAGSNGSITAVGGGGSSPYQYSINGGTFSSTSNFTGLTSGVYSVTVKDNNNCTFTQTTSVNQPAPLALSFTTAPTACLGSTGTATLGVSGGTPAYSYSVNGTPTGSLVSGLAVGSYSISVIDNSGCPVGGNFNINMVSGPTSAVIVTGNATCGSANGTATVTSVTGGLPSYLYSFNGSAFSLSNNSGGLAAGVQTVVVKDANGCTYTITPSVNNTGSPTANITASVNVNCFGGSNGSFTTSTSGGVSPYTYTLSPGGITNGTGIFTGLSAQSYNVNVKDAVGCITTVSITITQPTQLTLTLTPTAVNCNGGTNGSISASGSGGALPYQYALNGGAFTGLSNYTGLSAGTHSITIRDNNNCSLTLTTNISQPLPLSINFTTSPNSCAGSVGSVTVGVSGGTPVYNYSVNGTSSFNTASGLASGTNSASVSDGNGCPITGTFNIGSITGPSAATVVTTNANCGNANGSATVTTVSGGLTPYQYSFNGSPFSSSNIQPALTAGIKTVTVLDANTCTLTITFPIGNTGGPLANISNVTDVSCNGGTNGSFTINTVGGTPGYNYTLTPGNLTSGTGVFSGLAAGSFTAIVKDAAGCITTITTSITEPGPLTLSLSSVPTNCNGSSDGSISTSASGGVGPYQFCLNGGTFQASTTFTGVASGVYNITVKDNNTCTLTQSVSVGQPAVMNLVTTSINSNCTAANGTASVTVSGGLPAYTYTWSGGGGNSAQTNSLVAGIYTVTVADSKGCSKTAVATISSSPGGTAVISSSTNVTCNGLSNGSMTAGTMGPMSPPLTYSWSNGQVTQTASNLVAGSYSVIVTDIFGCVSTTSGSISQPGVLDMMVTTTSVSCFGGNNGTATSIYGGGGTPPLTYLWSPGGSTTSVVPNLPIGVYTCTLTDALGCTAIKSGTITQPSSVTLTSTVTTANCNQSNGSATVSASGGTPGYTYTWSTSNTGAVLNNASAGTYTILVNDFNNCTYTTAATVPNASGPVFGISSQTNVSCFGGNNGVATATVTGGVPPYIYLWSNGQNTGAATNLPAGIHTATVTDQMGCAASLSVQITQPALLTVSVSGTDPKCFGSSNGTANAGVLGGTPGYTYSWIPSGSTSPSVLGLGAGNHIVTVVDNLGCIASGSIALSNPPQMTASYTQTNVSCFNACNGQAIGSASNTVGAVTWIWIGGPAPLTTQNITNLCAGVYTLTATDQNSCTASAVATITQPSLLTASITASGNASCAGYTDGFATVQPGGGTPVYNYSWSPSGGTLATANNLGAGTYTVTITDALGCSTSTNVTITQPTPLLATLTSTNVTCNGANNGIGNLSYSGGTGPYTFLWFPTLANNSNVANLPPGTHTVQITDNLGCITTRTTTITEPSVLSAAMSSTNSNCTQANGNACVTPAGGAGGYTYQWTSNPNFTLSCINNVVAGPYTVTVTDANGCTANAIAIINDIAGPTVVISSTTAVSCFGGNNGIAVASISGGTGTVSIVWSYLAQTTNSVSNLPSGLHSITIMDAANCVASASVQMTQPTALTSAITNVAQVTCNGYNDGQATMLLNGGTPVYTYSWMPMGQNSPTVTNLSPGTHTCLATDFNGCTTSQTVSVNQPSPLAIANVTVTNLTCNGNNSGQIATTIAGGTQPYNLTWSPTQPANPVITNLASGSYSLSVVDQKGCPAIGSWFVSQPPVLTSAATASPATCGNANGAATVTVNGGTPNYTYNWNTPSPQLTTIATGLASNTWNCVITDANGCTVTQTVMVPNAPGPAVTGTSVTQPLCFGQQNGSMSVSFTSGTSPFLFQWNDPNASTTQTVNSVGAGVYSATVTDAYGCVANAVVNVAQPAILTLTSSPNFTLCYGQVGQVYAQGIGGTPPYSYTWNPTGFVGGGPHTVSLTANANYAVSVSDNNGCISSLVLNTNIHVLPPLLVSGEVVSRCHGDSKQFTPTFDSPGNGGPYTYQWSTGSPSASISVTANYPTNPNTYSVMVSDGCSLPDTALFIVNVNPLPIGDFSADVLKGCQPLPVIFNATSNDSTNSYTWNVGSDVGAGSMTGSPISYVYTQAGFYNVDLTIETQFGCKITVNKPQYIEVYPKPIAAFTPDPATTSELNPTVQFINQSMGAINYSWNFGEPASGPNNISVAVSPQHFYDLPANYTVSLLVTSDKGCKDSTVRVVEITPEFALYIPNAFTPDGNGSNDMFMPLGRGIDVSNYRLYIFDRWGEVIFTSDDIKKGWDGSVKGGNIVPKEDVYVYKILVRDLLGVDHEFVGHVTSLPKQSKY